MSIAALYKLEERLKLYRDRKLPQEELDIIDENLRAVSQVMKDRDAKWEEQVRNKTPSQELLKKRCNL